MQKVKNILNKIKTIPNITNFNVNNTMEFLEICSNIDFNNKTVCIVNPLTGIIPIGVFHSFDIFPVILICEETNYIAVENLEKYFTGFIINCSKISFKNNFDLTILCPNIKHSFSCILKDIKFTLKYSKTVILCMKEEFKKNIFENYKNAEIIGNTEISTIKKFKNVNIPFLIIKIKN